MTAKPAKAAAKPAKAIAALSAQQATALSATPTKPAEGGSVYAIEPDDPQLMKTLKASLGAQDMQTAQFAMVRTALEPLAPT